MDVADLHEWDVSTDKAKHIQRELRDRVRETGFSGGPRYIAGADCSFRRSDGRAWGGVVVYDLDRDRKVEEQVHEAATPFPYVPGLLSFREVPVLLPCFRRLETRPDLVIADGHGRAHPERFGLACRLGLFLGISVIGCAKSALIGNWEEPDEKRGSYSPLRTDEGHQVGTVLRTRTGVKPVFVSIGHNISLASSREQILRAGDGYKLPEPQRKADHLVTRERKKNGGT